MLTFIKELLWRNIQTTNYFPLIQQKLLSWQFCCVSSVVGSMQSEEKLNIFIGPSSWNLAELDKLNYYNKLVGLVHTETWPEHDEPNPAKETSAKKDPKHKKSQNNLTVWFKDARVERCAWFNLV